LSVENPPLDTLIGLAVKVTTGAGTTVTVTVALPVPPTPLHVRVKLVVSFITPVDRFPFGVLEPIHPPEAVQLVASVEVQVRVEKLPLGMLVGLAVNVTVGAGTTVTVAVCAALPPGPVHVRV
jgi:hypothetical protein